MRDKAHVRPTLLRAALLLACAAILAGRGEALLATRPERSSDGGVVQNRGAVHSLGCSPRELAFDCNHNGVEDAIDIAVGASVDANQNGVPDECEAACERPALARPTSEIARAVSWTSLFEARRETLPPRASSPFRAAVAPPR
jgi:hypothetical protein